MPNLIKVTKDKAIAFRFFTELKSLLKKQGLLYLDIGRLLKIIRDEKYYHSLGYDTWLDFIRSESITIKQSTVYAYISIYEMYVMKYGMPLETLAEIPWDKLQTTLAVVRKAKGKEEAEEWVAKARELSRSDLAIEIGEDDPIMWSKTRIVKAFKCDDCEKWRVDLNENEICKCK